MGQEDFTKGLQDIFTREALTPSDASVATKSYIIQKGLDCGTLITHSPYTLNNPMKFALHCMLWYMDKFKKKCHDRNSTCHSHHSPTEIAALCHTYLYTCVQAKCSFKDILPELLKTSSDRA